MEKSPVPGAQPGAGKTCGDVHPRSREKFWWYLLLLLAPIPFWAFPWYIWIAILTAIAATLWVLARKRRDNPKPPPAPPAI